MVPMVVSVVIMNSLILVPNPRRVVQCSFITIFSFNVNARYCWTFTNYVTYNKENYIQFSQNGLHRDPNHRPIKSKVKFLPLGCYEASDDDRVQERDGWLGRILIFCYRPCNIAPNGELWSSREALAKVSFFVLLSHILQNMTHAWQTWRNSTIRYIPLHAGWLNSFVRPECLRLICN